MGYCTDLYGEFTLNNPLTDSEIIFLQSFNETRHFKRDVTKLGFPKDYFGVDGEFYVSYPESVVKELKNCVLDPHDPLYKYYTAPAGLEKGIMYLNVDDDIRNFHNTKEEREKYGVIDYNKPAGSCPSLYCPWTVTEDGTAIIPDDIDKPYDFVAWIVFIIKNFLKPKKYELTGEVKWQGEESEDFGKICIQHNEIHVFQGVQDYRELASNEIENRFGLTINNFYLLNSNDSK